MPAVPKLRRKRLALCAVVIAAGTLQACGSGGKSPGQNAAAKSSTQPVSAEDRLAERSLVTQADVAAAKPGAPRAFVQYWDSLDFEEYGAAVESLDPRLRRAFKPVLVFDALRNEAANNHPVKPLIRGVRTVRGQTFIRYFVRTSAGKLRATSTAWVKRSGEWVIAFSPTFGGSLAAAAQQEVQNRVDPAAKQPAAAAVRAGSRAARVQDGVYAGGKP